MTEKRLTYANTLQSKLSTERETVEQVDFSKVIQNFAAVRSSAGSFYFVINADIVLLLYRITVESVRVSCSCKRLAMADCQTHNKVC